MLDEYLALGGVELGNNARAYGYSQCLSCCNGMLKCPACVGLHDASGQWTDAQWEWLSAAVNQASNPSFEAASAGGTTVRLNRVTRPNFELAYGSLEVRRNLALSPQKDTGPGGWNLAPKWFGPAGSTGQWETIPAAVPGAPGITTATRKVWTSVGGTPQDVSWGMMTQRVAVVPGEKYTVSFYIRPSWSTGTPTEHKFTFDGFNVASGGTLVAAVHQANGVLPPLVANAWTRIFYTFTIPAGVTWLEGSHTFYSDNNSAYWPTPGHSLDATGLLVEKNTDLVGTFFDGTTPPDGDGLSFAWSGAAQATPSVAYGQQVAQNANDDLIGYQSGPVGARHIKIVPKWTQGGWGMVLRDSLPGAANTLYTAMMDVTLNQDMNVNFRLERGNPNPANFAFGPLAAGQHHLRLTYSGTGAGDLPVIAIGLNTVKTGIEVIRIDNLLITDGDYRGPYFDGSTPAKVRRNLVLNPTMAVGNAGWHGYYGPTIERDAADFHSAPGSMRLSRNSGPAQGAICDAVDTATPGQVHHLSAWVKAPVGVPYLVTIKHDDGGSGVLPEVHVGDGTWRFHDKTYTVPAVPEGLGYLRPMFLVYESDMANAGVGVGQPFLWFDDVLWEIGTTGPYFDGSTATAPYAAAWEGAANASASYLSDPDFTYVWGGAINDSESLQRAANPQGISGVYAAAVQSTRWSDNRTKSLRVTPSGASIDSFAYIEGDIGGLRLGMLPGHTYTAQAIAHLEAPFVTADAVRRIQVYWGIPGVGYVVVNSETAPNTVGDHPLSVTFTIPANANEAFIRLQNGSALPGDEMWWDDFMLVEGEARPYFDGATMPAGADPALARVGWTGAADASTSLLETYTLITPARSLEPPYTCENITSAPWWDDSRPESEEFAGSYLLSVSGITDGTLTAGVTEGIEDGGVIGAGRYATRSVRVRTMLIGCGRLAAQYGLAWLKAALGTTYCARHGDGCGTADLEFFLDCPPPLDIGDPNYAATTAPYRRYLHGVACTSGPIIAEEFETQSGAYVLIVDFILTAESPFVWAETVGVANAGTTLTAHDDIPFNLMRHPSAEVSDGVPAVVATQYAFNGSVEYGNTGWQSDFVGMTGSALTGEVSTDIAAVGPNSYRSRVVATSTITDGILWIVYDVSLAGLPVGAKPSVSMWAAVLAFAGTPQIGSLSGNVEWRTASAAISETSLGTVPINGGNLVANGLTIPAGAVVARLRVKASGVNAVAGDDIRLYGDAFALTVP